MSVTLEDLFIIDSSAAQKDNSKMRISLQRQNLRPRDLAKTMFFAVQHFPAAWGTV